MKFRDHLPENCPPEAAKPGSGSFYRLLIDDRTEVKSDDFLSHRELDPDKIFTAPECDVCCLSIFSSVEGLKNLLKKRPKWRKRSYISFTLLPEHGEIESSPSNTSDEHYSWWIYKDVDPLTIPVTMLDSMGNI